MRALVAVVACVSVAGCSSRGAHAPRADSPPDGSAGASSITFTAEERELLRSFAPATLPPPIADRSNRFADDAAAARLGQKLFFDAAFSGALLDKDNDGGPNSLGTKGQVGRVSCAGCHVPVAAFTDNRSTFQQISLGTGWTHRRSPSLYDVGQAKIVMWGGRHSTLWSQPFGPIENPLEMNTSRLFVAQEIAKRYAAEYEAIFGSGSLSALSDTRRFPPLTPERTGCQLTSAVDQPRALPPDPIYECHGMPGDGAEYDGMTSDDQSLVTQVVVNAGKAIAAYERLLSCGPSRFDAWVNGDASALDEAEQRGLKIFIGRGKCASCHSGPFFSDQRFHNTGLRETVTKEGILNGNDHGAATDLPMAVSDPVGILGPYSDGDDGRLPADIGSEYEGAFRTPTLRCVAQRPTYMHSGTMDTLEQVVAFFSRGGDPSGYQGTSELMPVSLTPDDIRDLVKFLQTLDGPGAPADLRVPPG